MGNSCLTFEPAGHTFSQTLGEGSIIAGEPSHPGLGSLRDGADWLLRRAIDVLHEGIVIQDSHGAIVEANPAALKILSLTREQIVGKTSLDPSWRAVDANGAPLDGENHPSMVALRTRQPQRNFVMGVYPGDAQFRWININVEIVEVPGDSQIWIVATFVDITEEKRSVDALRGNNAVLSATLSTLPDALMVIDKSGAIVLQNTGTDQLQNEVNFNRQLSLWDALEVQTPEGDALRLDQWPSWRALQGESTDNFEIRVRPRGSDVPWLPMLLSARPLFHPEGVVERAIVLARDITKEKEARDALRDNNALLSEVFDALPGSITLMDRSGRLVLENANARKSREGYNVGADAPILDALEQSWEFMERILPDGSPVQREHDPVARAFAGERVDNLELRIRRRGTNDEWRYIQVSTRPLPGPDGKIDRIIRLSRDVTKQHKAQAERAANERMLALGKLAGGIAHDFNNLLTATITSASLILTRDNVPDEVTKLARLILESARHGDNMTRRLLSFARRSTVGPQRINVNELVRRSIGLLRPIIGAGVAIEARFDADQPYVTADYADLTTSIINLAVNARDAMNGAGVITIVTANEGSIAGAETGPDQAQAAQSVTIAVRDTGPGIPVELRERIFEPFFTTKEDGGGSGLGLAMVHGFVSRSGGRVELLERNEAGAGLALILPCCTAFPAADAAPTIPSPLDWSPRVLLVEDDPLVRESLLMLLKTLGCEAAAAAGGDEALELAARGLRFDILLTDLSVKGPLDGVGIACALAAQSLPHRVIYMSGADVSPERMAPMPGTVLPKPFSECELIEALRERPKDIPSSQGKISA